MNQPLKPGKRTHAEAFPNQQTGKSLTSGPTLVFCFKEPPDPMSAKIMAIQGGCVHILDRGKAVSFAFVPVDKHR